MWTKALSALAPDAAERMAAIERALRGLLDDAPERRPLRLIDAGGAPGRIARALEILHPGWEIIVVDLPGGGAGRYVRASALALPFADGSADAVYSSDVLEHIAPASRPPFLRELARVARRGVVVGAPFAHPAAARAELLLEQLHEQCVGGPHPWFEEHIRHGLPDFAASAAELAAALGTSIKAVRRLPNAPIERWFLFQAGEILSQAFPGGREPWRKFQDAILERWLKPAIARASKAGVEDFIEDARDKEELKQDLRQDAIDAPFLPYRWVLSARRAGPGAGANTNVGAGAAPGSSCGCSPAKKYRAAAAAAQSRGGDRLPSPATVGCPESLAARLEAIAALAGSWAAAQRAAFGSPEFCLSAPTAPTASSNGAGESGEAAIAERSEAREWAARLAARDELIRRLSAIIEDQERRLASPPPSSPSSPSASLPSPPSHPSEASRVSHPTSLIKQIWKKMR